MLVRAPLTIRGRTTDYTPLSCSGSKQRSGLLGRRYLTAHPLRTLTLYHGSCMHAGLLSMTKERRCFLPLVSLSAGPGHDAAFGRVCINLRTLFTDIDPPLPPLPLPSATDGLGGNKHTDSNESLPCSPTRPPRRMAGPLAPCELSDPHCPP
jgi:hypothetical protein